MSSTKLKKNTKAQTEGENKDTKIKNSKENSKLDEKKQSNESLKTSEKKSTTSSEDSNQIKNNSNSAPKTASVLSNAKSQGILSNLVGENRELSRYAAVVDKILALDEKMQALSDKQLRDKTFEFREMFNGLTGKAIQKKLDEILPEAFAVVREGAFRAIGQKHYPVQLIGAMVLHEGRVAEMKTGEGKTLSATAAIYLNALPQQSQVHLVTVNDYLARRDASWMGKVYNFLGLTVGVIQNQSSFYFKLGAQSDSDADKKREIGLVDVMDDGILQDKRSVLDVENLVSCDRKRAYFDPETNKPVDIVYGVNSEFGFDYLRDNMAQTPDDIVQKAGHVVAVVDEVDSILIDEARTPLIISSADADSSARYRQFAEIVKKLNSEIDYEVDEKFKKVTLTELGLEKIERILGVENLYGSGDNVILIHHLDQALKAHTLFLKEREYVVRDGEIVIVDQNTGHMMYGRRYSEGLHQAIEAKENLNVQAESRTAATITFQNFFRLYKKLAGMTGTAATESEELFKIYKLLVVTIPTNRKSIRIDHGHKIFKNELGKFKALVKDVQAIHKTGQPILIGTTSIDKNQLLSQMLTDAQVPHNVLNAKNHEQEAFIISKAGTKGAVTVATNIAGRGVDIKLGGELPEDPKELPKWQKDHEEIKQLGGLYVIGTELHESRRIDNQLRGRSGRQGDPGVSQFYISLQDYIIRVFGGDGVKYYDILPIADDESISVGALTFLITEAQKKIEGQNFDQRKYVTEYDDVINKQRSVIYTRRQKVLLGTGFDWKVETEKALYNEVYRILNSVKKAKNKRDLDPESIKQASSDLKAILSLTDFDSDVLKILFRDNGNSAQKVTKILHNKLVHQLNNRWEIYENRVQSGLSRFVFLRAIDLLWKEHLVTISHLQDSVKLRHFSQRDPLVEFKQDGMDLFINLLIEIDKEICRTLFKVTPDLVPSSILKEVVS